MVIPGRFFTWNDKVDVTGRRIFESPSKVAMEYFLLSQRLIPFKGDWFGDGDGSTKATGGGSMISAVSLAVPG